MSSNHIALRVSHLGKKYQLGGPQEPYHTVRDVIVKSLKMPMQGFWALKDVSFEVSRASLSGSVGGTWSDFN